MRSQTLTTRWLVPVALIAAVGITLSWRLERDSVERANRLHRAGDLTGAAGLYGSRLARDSASSRLRYNRGTTLLVADVSDASAEFHAAADSEDSEVRVRSLYNLGLWSLRQAAEAESPDSVRLYALESVRATKEALRLAPGRPDARWNLAMAQRMLDEVRVEEGRPGTSTADGSAEANEIAPASDTLSVAADEPPPDGPRQGNDEAPARSDEVAPLTILEAEDVLGEADRDAAPMIRKLLAFEGRSQRRTRLGRTTPRW
jgi:hypothetical protein